MKSRGPSPFDDSAVSTPRPVDNTMALLMTKKAEFIIDETNSKEDGDDQGKAVLEQDMLNANSKLSVNRQSSIVSDSKLT